MRASNSNQLGFQKKYLVSWVINGIVVSLVGFFVELYRGSTSDVLLGPFVFVLGMPLIGLTFFALEGIFSKKFKFAAVEHPQWFWHIYPMVIILGISVGFILTMLGVKSNSRE